MPQLRDSVFIKSHYQMLIITLLLSTILALRFEQEATSSTRKCVQHYYKENEVVAGQVEIPAVKGHNIEFSVAIINKITDDSSFMNRYFLKENVIGIQKFSVATTTPGNLKFCFKSSLDSGVKPSSSLKRQVFLHITDGMEQSSLKSNLERFHSLIADINYLNTSLAGSVILHHLPLKAWASY